MSVRERRYGVLGKFTMVVFIVLAIEAVPATSLNTDGIALLEFKKGIISDPHNALQSWNSSDATPCLWNGISCMRIQGVMEERVVHIKLPRKALGGTLSPSLGDLDYLDTVNLHTNKLHGQIPSELFKALNLSRLYLSKNNLTGDIPAEIRYLGQKLRVLEARDNGLTKLPEDIIYCYRLRRLLLSNNYITGVVPIGIGSNLTQLERLDLSVNLFYGTIPEGFSNLTALQGTLNLSSNHLSGSIPQSLANLREVFIDFSNNNLSGPIPSDAYFQSLGPQAYVGNVALCGSPLESNCAPSAGFIASGPDISNKKNLSRAAVIGIAVGCGTAGLLMATLIFYFFMRKLNITKKTLSLHCPSGSDSINGLRGCLCSWRESASGSMSAEEEDEGDLVHLSGALSFDLEELLRASAYVLGNSRMGIVYKAVLDEGTVVAVRRLSEGGKKRQREFEAEVKTIAQVRHPNIVGLHSYSWTAEEKLLIYDYLSNGSLETALHGRPEGSKGPLPWETRLQIARGAAQGIAHIHDCGLRKYIHGEIKPGNILLDALLEARIADFGLQRLLALGEPEPVKEFGSLRFDTGRASSVSPAHEFGRWAAIPRSHAAKPFMMAVYQDPEAGNGRGPTQKSDVYSFGVVLLELLTGRSPFKQLAGGELDLVSWMRIAIEEKIILSEIFDPYLLHCSTSEQNKMIDTLQVALACIAVNPDSRPKMKQVAESLEEIEASE